MPEARRPRDPNNYVAEWFGHVVWPSAEVDASPQAVADQVAERCPFMSSATATDVPCVKTASDGGTAFRTGFCTASIPNGGEREDWLACPIRVFDEPFTLIREAVSMLYGLPEGQTFSVYPISRFGDDSVLLRVRELDTGGSRLFAFSSNPPALGGEIDIPATPRSPANKVDVTIAEVLGTDPHGGPKLGRVAVFEIQTADFHGSPLHAIKNLRELGPPTKLADYHSDIAASGHRLGQRVEGPNRANIFKRTIYQIILKIQMAKDPRCVGFCVVLPEPVWRSWAVHLGGPALVPDHSNPMVQRLRVPGVQADQDVVEAQPAWIIVFRVDRGSTVSPKPLQIVTRIATDSAALIHYAFDAAPEAAISYGAMTTFEGTFRHRLSENWVPLDLDESD